MKTQLVLCLFLQLFAGSSACIKEKAVAESQVAHITASSPVADYGIYTFRCVAGGKYMEVSGNPLYNEKYDDARKITQYAASVSNGSIDGWQQWHVIYHSTAGNIKYYHIRNVFSGKLLDVPSGMATPGLQLQQYAALPFSGDQQLWKIEATTTSGTYRIINKGNGLALTNGGAAAGNGTPITQEVAATTASQQWMLTAQPATTYRDDDVVRFFNRNNPAQGSVAFDQGNSIPLGNGQVLWITQDAWDGISIQPNGQFRCEAFFSYGNSILIQPTISNWDPAATPNMLRDSSAQQKPKQICDIQPGNTFAWPGPGVQIGNHVYVQCGEGSGLIATNQSLYDLTPLNGNKWQATRLLPPNMSGQAAINYATGMVKAADGYVYTFGSQATGFGYACNVHVARFPENNPMSWSFWNGSSWTTTPVSGEAARITEGLGTVAMAYFNGKYVLITMDQGFNCDSSRNIYMATADSPTGPFTARTRVYTIKEYLYGSYARYYTPAIHPHAVNGRNELLVTYSLNYSACGGEECKDGYRDPYYYRVKGIRIPWELSGNSNQ
ncbi:RICIN domain-containing protein [Chitinophaga rhizophila]|uniref:RICIN domain-containing protein n=1 Tax=Chitinophaga rhizophila TaxID=2866212 RepID=A0ABS7GCR7_9BACT|nr:RICIN domain-containing protein [Chitinophaga rhizophila]MBW8684599.1 RICIN domain-containing protein [Chitinophaga rhizophila]